MSERIKLLAREAWDGAPYFVFVLGSVWAWHDQTDPTPAIAFAAFWLAHRAYSKDNN